MNTSRSISTISYNTQEFLVMKLEELIDRHIISSYIFINHFAEEDERKNHIHLFVQPNKRIDTMTLSQEFIEFEEGNNKPLKCIEWRYSSIDDWILYNIHFEPYLRSKGESRKYHYTYDDLVCCDEDLLDYYFNHAMKASDFALKCQILNALTDENLSPIDLIKNGTVPLNMASQLQAYKYLESKFGHTNRGGRKGHEEE